MKREEPLIVGSKGEDIPVCAVCEKDKIPEEEENSKLVQCTSACKLYFHKQCANESLRYQLRINDTITSVQLLRNTILKITL